LPAKHVPLIEAHRAALHFFGAGRPAASSAATLRFLIGAVVLAIVIPALFVLRFGTVNEFGWGFTVFMVVLCLLAAAGIYFADKPRYHSPVLLKGDWLDWIGAFWLVTCAFGPLVGWLLTESSTPALDSWRWQFAGRTLFAIILPVTTALPLTRYARGNATLIALVLLIGVTALPVLSSVTYALDLAEGPVVRQLVLTLNDDSQLTCLTLDGGSLDIPCNARAWGGPADTVAVTYLRHTSRLLSVRKLTSTA
jgi:hypothetical protein